MPTRKQKVETATSQQSPRQGDNLVDHYHKTKTEQVHLRENVTNYYRYTLHEETVTTVPGTVK